MLATHTLPRVMFLLFCIIISSGVAGADLTINLTAQSAYLLMQAGDDPSLGLSGGTGSVTLGEAIGSQATTIIGDVYLHTDAYPTGIAGIVTQQMTVQVNGGSLYDVAMAVHASGGTSPFPYTGSFSIYGSGQYDVGLGHNTLLEIDTEAAGSAAFQPPTPYLDVSSPQNFTFSIVEAPSAPTPEMGTIGMCALGLFMLIAGCRWRRHRRCILQR